MKYNKKLSLAVVLNERDQETLNFINILAIFFETYILLFRILSNFEFYDIVSQIIHNDSKSKALLRFEQVK